MVAHLNIHTAYDLLNASLRIEDVINKAKNEGYTALAITDTHVLYGFPKFYDACIAADIHPIFGMTLILTDGLYKVETVVLAQNNEGLKALYQLSSAIKMKEKEEVPLEWLKRYDDNLIIIFKDVESTHLQILEAFNDHTHVYMNHTSDDIIDRKKVWLQSARYLKEKMQIRYLLYRQLEIILN